MADKPKPPPPKRVAVLDPQGKFWTIDASDVENLPYGARVLSAKEIAQKEVDDAYAAKSTGSKIAGAIVGPTASQLAEPTAQAITGKANPNAVAAAPSVEAFSHGGLEPFTLGLERVGIKKATEALAGKEAADKYVQHGEAVDQAYEGTKLAGNIAGMAAQMGMGSGGAAKALPGLGISALGEGAESLAARALSGVAKRGVLGRAAASAGELGARGAVEGAAFAGGQEASHELLVDPELSTDKILAATGSGALWGGAGGAALGGAGSLAKSGFKGAVSSMAERRANRAAEEVFAPPPEPTHLPYEPGTIQPHQKLEMIPLSDVTEQAPWSAGKMDSIRANLESGQPIQPVRLMRDDAGKWAASDGIHRVAISREQGMTHIPALVDATEHIAATPPLQTPPGKRSIADFWADAGSVEGQKGLAYDQAWRAVGAGQGLQTTRYAGRAAKYLPNGTRDVGEVLMRRGVINAEDGVWAAAKGGTPAALLPKIEQQVESVGQRIGQITDMSPARISGAAIDDALAQVANKYSKQAGRSHVAQAVRDYGTELTGVLGITGRDSTVSLQDLLAQRKILDDIVYNEAKTLDPKARVAALREVRSNLENVIVDAMDDASGKVAGEVKAEYKTLKKDYLALSIAKDAAEDSATRMSKNRIVSASDYAAGIMSAASGNLLAAPVAAIGHKLVRERGNAAAAVALYNAATSGKLNALVAKTDNMINAAANGLLTTPPKGLIPQPSGGRLHAQTTMKQIAAMQADPEATTEKIAQHVSGIEAAHPEIAQALVQRHVAAITFLASKMPVAADKDPLDPHPVPRMTDADAATFNRYEWYAAKPERFFSEMKMGKITYEGAETAQALMPRAFAELQERTMDAIATHMSRGRRIPFQQRQKIGDMLDIPATPAQQPAHAAFLQANTAVLDSGKNKAPSANKGPSKGLSQRSSALDALEASGPGRR